MADKIIIDYVRDRPHMWNFNRNDSHQPNQNGSWEQLSKLLCVDIVRLKKRWRYLRDAYVRARKAMAEGSCPIPKWKFYNEMTFLDYVVRHRTVPMDIGDESRLQLLSQSCSNDNIELDFSEQQAIKQEVVLNHFTNEAITTSSTSSPKISSICSSQSTVSDGLISQANNHLPEVVSLIDQAKPIDNATSSMSKEIVVATHVRPTVSQSGASVVEKDDITLFGEQIAASLRKLSARAQSHAKIRIQQVIFELEQSDFESSN